MKLEKSTFDLNEKSNLFVSSGCYGLKKFRLEEFNQKQKILWCFPFVKMLIDTMIDESQAFMLFSKLIIHFNETSLLFLKFFAYQISVSKKELQYLARIFPEKKQTSGWYLDWWNAAQKIQKSRFEILENQTLSALFLAILSHEFSIEMNLCPSIPSNDILKVENFWSRNWTKKFKRLPWTKSSLIKKTNLKRMHLLDNWVLNFPMQELLQER